MLKSIEINFLYIIKNKQKFRNVLTLQFMNYIIHKENEDKQNMVTILISQKKARWCRMLEEILLQLLVLSLFTNVALTIISFILIIVITIITYRENHISADQ